MTFLSLRDNPNTSNAGIGIPAQVRESGLTLKNKKGRQQGGNEDLLRLVNDRHSTQRSFNSGGLLLGNGRRTSLSNILNECKMRDSAPMEATLLQSVVIILPESGCYKVRRITIFPEYITFFV